VTETESTQPLTEATISGGERALANAKPEMPGLAPRDGAISAFEHITLLTIVQSDQ